MRKVLGSRRFFHLTFSSHWSFRETPVWASILAGPRGGCGLHCRATPRRDDRPPKQCRHRYRIQHTARRSRSFKHIRHSDSHRISTCIYYLFLFKSRRFQRKSGNAFTNRTFRAGTETVRRTVYFFPHTHCFDSAILDSPPQLNGHLLQNGHHSVRVHELFGRSYPWRKGEEDT